MKAVTVTIQKLRPIKVFCGQTDRVMDKQKQEYKKRNAATFHLVLIFIFPPATSAWAKSKTIVCVQNNVHTLK